MCLVHRVRGIKGGGCPGTQEVTVTFFQIVEWACVPDSMNITIRVVLSVDPTYFICKSHFKHLLPSEVNSLECLYCIVLYVLADLDNK